MDPLFLHKAKEAISDKAQLVRTTRTCTPGVSKGDGNGYRIRVEIYIRETAAHLSIDTRREDIPVSLSSNLERDFLWL